MKLRLQITTPQGDSMTFEHPGPVVRIGRDATCELALQGEASNSVSRRHACIELSPGGATVADTGSSNGTLLNDKPVDRPAPLRRGDRVQLGYTGATLTVLELDLSASPAPARAPTRALPWLIGAGVAGAALLLVGLLVWFNGRSRNGAEGPPPPIPPPTPPEQPSKQPPPKPPPSPKPPPPPSPPQVKVIPVGSYYWRKETPSVLLQRRGETESWRVLRPEEAVYTAHTLMSLPGYESVVTLDRLRVKLWGTLPEFAREFTGVPPFLLESAVMLNAPAEGVDLDLTLERGRVEIANSKRGEAAVRLRFLWEVWDVTLLDDKSMVCVELWGLPPQATGPTSQPTLCLGLFTQGPVRLRTQREPFELEGPSRVTWVSWEKGSVRRKKLDQPPDWWGKRPKGTAEVNDVLLSLKDWSVLFDRLDSAKDPDPAQMILKHVADPGDRKLEERTTQLLGVLFLAALDDLPSLLRFLGDKDPDYADIRGTAAHGLRAWLSRNADRSAELVRMVRNRGLPRDEAELIVRLLHFYPAKALERPETYQELIKFLDHGNLAVRYLASWWLREGLAFRVPPKALSIPYNPVWEDKKKREQAVAEWKKAIPPESVPPVPATGPGAPRTR